MSVTALKREPRPWAGEAAVSETLQVLGDRSSPELWGKRVEDKQLIAMVHAHRRTGGLATSDEVVRILRRRSNQPISMVARWIVTRSVVSFVWKSQTLLPLFQFDLSDMSLCRGTSEVVQELSGAFDDWDLATWFARPNSLLHGAAPVDLIATDPAAVLQAAREDRFVALGS